MNSTIETYESNVRSYCRKFPVVFDKAKESFLYDIKGNKYIDFFCGAGTLNYGHNNDYIKQAVVDYISNDLIIHGLDMTTKAKVEFIEFFEDEILKQRNLDYKIMFPNSTGANAVEAALKTARAYTGRNTIWTLMGDFHGMTLGALALTSDSYSRSGAGVPLTGEVHIPAPYMFPDLDVAAYLRTILDDDHSGYEKPAAIVIETTQAEGGVWTLENDFLQGLRKICDDYEILLIVDDIQIGCWRTGTFFSFERAKIVPDIITMSKSIGGFGLPFAIVLLKPEFDCLKPGQHNGTFRGNQLAMVASKASLEFALNNNLEQQVQEKSLLIDKCLNKIEKQHNVKTRGIGFIRAIELNDTKKTLDALHKCFDNGLIIELCGRNSSALKVMPALTIDNNTLKKGFDIISVSL